MLGHPLSDEAAIERQLAITYRAVAELVPDARNARTHSRQQVEQIAASIRNFGFTNPVLIDEAAGVIAGHGRLLAARAIGLGEVPTITLAGLSGPDKRALMLADNRIALGAGWDMGLLKLELGELKALDIDLGLTGFSAGEIEVVFDEPGGDEARSRDTEEKKNGTLRPGSGQASTSSVRTEVKGSGRTGLGDSGVPSPAPPPPGTRPGDVWQLGAHRIGCGDVREAGFFKALIGHAPVAGIWVELAGALPVTSFESVLRLRSGRTENADGAICWCAADPARVDAVIEEWVWATGGTPERVRSGEA